MIPCYIHLERNVKKRILPKEHKSNILEDIRLISKSVNQEEFNLRNDLFYKKWRLLKNDEIEKFLDYFKAQYLDKHSNWYLGGANIPGVGNTNNSIEGFNCAFKKHFTDYTMMDIVKHF